MLKVRPWPFFLLQTRHMADKMLRTGITDFEACSERIERNLKDCVAKIRATGEVIHLQKGAFLAPDLACWLDTGKCVLTLDDSRGDTISLFYFQPGQLVNFLPLLVKCFPLDATLLKRKIPSSHFHVKALTDCTLYSINHDWFAREFGTDPGLCSIFLHSAMLNLINSYKNVWNAPILSNTQRICTLIMASVEEGGVIPSYLTQAEISRHLSMHPITVAKIFAQLRKSGLIEKKGSLLVVANPACLQALADGREKINY